MADWLYNSPGGMSLPLPEPPVLSVSSANPYCICEKNPQRLINWIEIIILYVKSYDVKGLKLTRTVPRLYMARWKSNCNLIAARNCLVKQVKRDNKILIVQIKCKVYISSKDE